MGSQGLALKKGLTKNIAEEESTMQRFKTFDLQMKQSGTS
jgi:hypothetical protein